MSTLRAMQAYGQLMPRAYFYLDLFCFNRHRGTLPDPEASLQQALKDVGALLVVLNPWSAPVWLTRAWCLQEFICALKVRAERGQPKKNEPKEKHVTNANYLK